MHHVLHRFKPNSSFELLEIYTQRLGAFTGSLNLLEKDMCIPLDFDTGDNGYFFLIYGYLI